MPDMDLANVTFAFDATVDKAWQDTKGKMHVRAVASDDQLDLQRDKMSGMALEKMAQMAKSGVPLLETHRHTFGFGRSVDGKVIQTTGEDGRPVNQLVVELELDGDYPQARSLFREVAGGNCQKQLSIGGKLNLKNRDAVTVEMTGGGLSRTINDLELDHIASTRKAQAANPRTSFVEAIAKSLDEATAAGWRPEVQNPLAKGGNSAENPPAVGHLSERDIQAGARFLANVGKTVRGVGGVDKMYGDDNGDAGETPLEPQEPEMAGHEKAKSLVSDVKTPTGESPEQGALKPAADKPGAMAAKSGGQALALAGEVATLLAKMGGGMDMGMEMGDTTPSTTPATTPYGEEEKALIKTLSAVRDLLAKKVEGASAGPGDGQAKLSDEGLFAPNDDSGASAGASPDKAPKGSDSDVGGSGVTDSRRDIQVGGEIKSTAPGAAEAYKATKGAVARDAKLPQQGDNDLFGKALDAEGYATLEKSMLEKQVGFTREVVTIAVEKMLEQQDAQTGQIAKSLDTIGGAVNEANRKAEALQEVLNKALRRIDSLEKAGGVSQSGPRGGDDGVVPLEKAGQRGGTWGGLFSRPIAEATANY